MRAMGIIRRLDELGRVVIPVEMRRMLDLADRDTVEIAVDGDRIVLQKHTPRCVFCSRSEALVEYHNRRVCSFLPAPLLSVIMIPLPMHFVVLSQTCHSHRRLRLPPLTTATCATLDTQSFSP